MAFSRISAERAAVHQRAPEGVADPAEHDGGADGAEDQVALQRRGRREVEAAGTAGAVTVGPCSLGLLGVGGVHGGLGLQLGLGVADVLLEVHQVADAVAPAARSARS